MKSSLKKSLYFGLAAVSVLAASSFASTTASAKTYAKVATNSTLTTAPESRNVKANGTNALYTKAGTLKGAKLVASKSTMSTLANSKSSKNYFRAYQVATTNRGSVYYKVVSFDGKYRGWIYGGKSTSVFGGGIASAKTTTDAKLPDQLTGYTITNVKKNTLWNNPQYTQYKASKVDMSDYKDGDTFTVSEAATKTREGSLYYKVTDDNNAKVTGWIYAGGLTAAKTNSVKVSYVDYSTNKSVGSISVPFSTSDTSTNLTTGTNFSAIIKGIPTGYSAYNTDSNSSASLSATTAKSGDTVTFYVKKGTSTNLTQSINVNVETTSGQAITLRDADAKTLTASGQKAAFQVTPGTAVSSEDVTNIIKDAQLETLVAADKTVYTLTSTQGNTTTTGSNVQVNVTAYYTAK
ncbi:S-layer protein [Secundilactobacillus odoratitofui DSM 19909 = JCM 15043]|uniref:S-layer protein n=1 Tax=Secundilactobacillus odoratitofui DSM 19909 = JCM 15043 TaxID=1423776 RepID=A0A0R1M092_9LACO|nr:hypothetical protein [Secundilactobacillus odoratitofui]KRK98673.1 S-layer protein [Secundilactobacillus odoratitofui DSM 19909 = JCM 15043]